MKQIFKLKTILGFLPAIMLFAACSNNKESLSQEKEGFTSVEFTVTEQSFGVDTEMGTRGIENVSQPDYVDIGDGIEAEVITERDTVPLMSNTRAITSDNHYTILAYKRGSNTIAGELKGKFDKVKHTFVPDAGRSDRLILEAWQHYDFIAYTDEYAGQRVGNKLTILAQHIDKMRIGVLEDVQIQNTKRQVINFQLTPLASRFRTKIVALIDIPADVKAKLGLANNLGASSGEYDLVSRSLSSPFTETISPVDQTYSITGTYDDQGTILKARTAAEYATFLGLPNDLEGFQLQFVSGKIYNGKLSGSPRRLSKTKIPRTLGGSYTIRIKLMPRFKYLFEDGIAGYRSEPGRKNHTPVGLVVAPNLAMSLWNCKGQPLSYVDVKGHYHYAWGPGLYQYNEVAPMNKPSVAFAYPESGKHWTWDASGSSNGTTVKAKTTSFRAFCVAANFYKELEPRLPAGQTLAAKLKGDGAWFLPSLKSWLEVYKTLSFTNGSELVKRNEAPLIEGIASVACRSAGGDDFPQGLSFASSTEVSAQYSYNIVIDPQKAYIINGYKTYLPMVRAFIEF